jgi:2-haloacid dehalogenase
MGSTRGGARVDRRTLLAGLAVPPIVPTIAGASTLPDRAAQVSSAPPGAVVVFDVNETLLDFEVLGPVFDRMFGKPGMLRAWFNQTVLYCEALTLAGEYLESGSVGIAALKMMADIEGRSIAPADLDDLKRLSAAMPTYADTVPALAALKTAGFRLVTLSNNRSAGVEAQLANAGLRTFFDELHSIDDQVRRYKPARESYTALAATLGVAPSDLWLVSCHAFDTLGAAAAGYRTALVLRPGNAPIALGRAPDIVAGSLETVAEQIIRSPNQRRHG